MICGICGKEKPDVCERDDNYAQEIGVELNAKHIACDDCDEQNTLDI